eukprot:CAMPEP_0194346062 /NCGR_PEP_ID=MMETSP0171-20130528/105212_1 /TAXON_ID=218684 /ORGANISM="Corethron pennatum, Strain L29A3" /LENGTH=1294 /DNA_ID=CAMNT_0039113135 /DNA_START=141 /DNA_END=4027 /DNA_ORIENTATION=+
MTTTTDRDNGVSRLAERIVLSLNGRFGAEKVTAVHDAILSHDVDAVILSAMTDAEMWEVFGDAASWGIRKALRSLPPPPVMWKPRPIDDTTLPHPPPAASVESVSSSTAAPRGWGSHTTPQPDAVFPDASVPLIDCSEGPEEGLDTGPIPINDTTILPPPPVASLEFSSTAAPRGQGHHTAAQPDAVFHDAFISLTDCNEESEETTPPLDIVSSVASVPLTDCGEGFEEDLDTRLIPTNDTTLLPLSQLASGESVSSSSSAPGGQGHHAAAQLDAVSSVGSVPLTDCGEGSEEDLDTRRKAHKRPAHADAGEHPKSKLCTASRIQEDEERPEFLEDKSLGKHSISLKGCNRPLDIAAAQLDAVSSVTSVPLMDCGEGSEEDLDTRQKAYKRPAHADAGEYPKSKLCTASKIKEDEERPEFLEDKSLGKHSINLKGCNRPLDIGSQPQIRQKPKLDTEVSNSHRKPGVTRHNLRERIGNVVGRGSKAQGSMVQVPSDVEGKIQGGRNRRGNSFDLTASKPSISSRQTGIPTEKTHQKGTDLGRGVCLPKTRSQRRRSSRVNRVYGQSNSRVEILVNNDESGSENSLKDDSKASLSKLHIGVSRIAIGKSVFKSSCSMTLEHDGVIVLGYKNTYEEEIVRANQVYGQSNSNVEILVNNDESGSENNLKGDSKASSSKLQIGVSRIAIGKRVFKSSCSMTLEHDGMILLGYKNTYEEQKYICLDLEGGSILELKYFLRLTDVQAKNSVHNKKSNMPSTEKDRTEMEDKDIDAFLAIRVTPDQMNGLKAFRNYVPTPKPLQDAEDFYKSYLIIEMQTQDELQKLLGSMSDFPYLKPYFMENCEISSGAGSYVQALVNDSRTEKEKRLRSRPASSRGFEENTLVLVYPFDGYENLINAEIFDNDVICDARMENNGESNSIEKNSECSNYESSNAKPLSSDRKRHYLTIMSEDMGRLGQGEFLNDTLIDFYMQWMIRKDDPRTSPVHLFSTHFYTTLKEEGVEAVTKWTAKNIFEKRFIFIPINGSLHWSLCVVVNPSKICEENVSHKNELVDETRNDNEGNEVFKIIFLDSLKMHSSHRVYKNESIGWSVNPSKICEENVSHKNELVDETRNDNEGNEVFKIIFLDSLKMHSTHRVYKNVIHWLVSEYERLYPKSSPPESKIFAENCLIPPVPYQDNAWDCGVFVCRYAYGLFKERNNPICKRDLNRKNNFITESKYFEFDMTDIAKMREDLKNLIEDISKIYLGHKEAEAIKKRKNRIKEKKISSNLKEACPPPEDKLEPEDKNSLSTGIKDKDDFTP